MNRVGMPSTTPGTDGLWGLTSTTSPDQVCLVRTVAYPNAVLTDASRAYLESLMRTVTPSQKWGVSGGVPASATVALKNGWLPRDDGWVINSIGHVRGGTRDYVIAVLTSGVPTMSYGITTTEHLSAMAWSRPLAQFGDFSGDGWPDLITRQTSSGALLLYRGNGRGLGAWARKDNRTEGLSRCSHGADRHCAGKVPLRRRFALICQGVGRPVILLVWRVASGGRL